ncbi:MAG: hypothetical protein JNM17_14230 [Archangium sp.]|nr:hypothetical protein [Archangium sp.]
MLGQVRELSEAKPLGATRLGAIAAAALLALAACTKDKPSEPTAPAVVLEKPAPADKPTGAEPFAASLRAKSDAYVAGQSGIAGVKIEARDGFHVNPDYPVAFKPTAAEGAVKFSQDRIPLSDGAKTACAEKAEDACAMEFDLSFIPEAGASSVQGVVAFSVCSAEKCLIEKVPLTLALSVK